MKYFIGVDIGTTATKAVLFDESARQVQKAESSYPLFRDASGMAEQEPEQIFSALLATLKKLSDFLRAEDKLLGVSFSSQMHSLIALDKDWQSLTRLLTWADSRPDEMTQELKARRDAVAIYARTGTPLHPMAPLSKLLWLKREKPDIFQRAAHFLDIKGYVFWRLFSVNKIDLSLASGTGIFNNQILDWDPELLDMLGLNQAQLPRIVSPYETERGHSEVLASCGLARPETAFIWGAGDGPLANLGVAAIDQGQVALTIGTSGAIRAMTQKPVADSLGRSFSYAIDEDHWVTGGPVNSGGDVFRWLQKDILEAKYSFDELTTLAAQAPVGSRGLLFHPYLAGERAPLWDAEARGDFYGLSYSHKTAELTRATLEGIIFNLFEVAESLGEITEIFATGGFTKSALWVQILADIFNKPVKLSQTSEAGCFAAVLLAQRALSLTSGLDCREEVEHIVYPLAENVAIYQELWPIYQGLTRQLQPLFKDITAFQKKHAK